MVPASSELLQLLDASEEGYEVTVNGVQTHGPRGSLGVVNTMKAILHGNIGGHESGTFSMQVQSVLERDEQERLMLRVLGVDIQTYCPNTGTPLKQLLMVNEEPIVDRRSRPRRTPSPALQRAQEKWGAASVA